MYKTLLVLLLLSPFAVFAEPEKTVIQGEPKEFTSPLEKHTVRFEITGHYKSKGTNDLDDVNHIRYKVSLTQKLNGSVIETEYTDVYGWGPNAAPVELSKIFQSMIWSPQEDFVIFPEEGWASAPSSPFREAVNLNNKLGWVKETVHMDIAVWADDFRIFGDVHDDCEYYVTMFDGKTGREVIVKKGNIPVGYQIAAVEGTKLTIEKVLDNCSSEQDILQFTPEIEIIDIRTFAK